MKGLCKTSAIQGRIMTAFYFISVVFAGSSPRTGSSSPLSRILYERCDPGTNPNANALLNALAMDAPLGGFNISIQGQGTDKLFGILECRGDLSQKFCADCSSFVVSKMQNLCSNASRAWIQLEGCYLRYDTYPFFWHQNDFYEIFHQCDEDSQPGPDFSEVLQAVVYEAPIFGGFSAAASSDQTYALAQCSAYVNPYDCGVCLRLALYYLGFDCASFSYMPYAEQNHGQILLDRCFLRFEQYRFFDREGKGTWWNLQFPSPLPHRVNKVAVGIIFGILGAAIVVLCSLGVCMKLKARRKLVQIHCIVENESFVGYIGWRAAVMLVVSLIGNYGWYLLKTMQQQLVDNHGEIPRLSDESTIAAATNHGMPNS